MQKGVIFPWNTGATCSSPFHRPWVCTRLWLRSVTQSRCNVRHLVTFPARDRHYPLTGTELYCTEQLARVVTQRHLHGPEVERGTSRSQVLCPTRCAPLRHLFTAVWIGLKVAQLRWVACINIEPQCTIVRLNDLCLGRHWPQTH